MLGRYRKSQKDSAKLDRIIIEKGPFEVLRQDVEFPSVLKGRTARPIYLCRRRLPFWLDFGTPTQSIS